MKDQSDYEVGYGKPPKHSQFPKGQSGNPKGRPKKLKNMQELLNEELEKKITVNGELVTKQCAIIRSWVHAAIKGSPSARKMVLERMENQEEELEPFDPTLDDEVALLKLTRMYDQRGKEES
jgi:hypothetical protein